MSGKRERERRVCARAKGMKAEDPPGVDRRPMEGPRPGGGGIYIHGAIFEESG